MKLLRLLSRYKKGLAGLAVITAVMLLASIWAGHAVQGRSIDEAGGKASPTHDTAAASAGSGTQPAEGAIVDSESEPPATPEFGIGGMALKVIASVAFVIGVLYIGMHAMRALSRRSMGGTVKQDAISVLHKRHIAPKKAVYVIKIADRAMVIGVTDSQINHLADLSPEELKSISVAEPKKSGEFKRHLLGFALGMRDKT